MTEATVCQDFTNLFVPTSSSINCTSNFWISPLEYCLLLIPLFCYCLTRKEGGKMGGNNSTLLGQGFSLSKVFLLRATLSRTPVHAKCLATLSGVADKIFNEGTELLQEHRARLIKKCVFLGFLWHSLTRIKKHV